MPGRSGGRQQFANVVPVKKSHVQEGQIVYGAIGGIALTFIIQLVGQDPPTDKWRVIALFCCACLIPISIIGFLIRSLEGGYERKFVSPWYVQVIQLSVIILCQIGIAAVFMYFDEYLGWLFAGLMMTGNLYYVIHARRLKALNKP